MKELYNNKSLKPMKLTQEENPFDSDDFLFEIKFDGIRSLIYVSPDSIDIRSINGVILNDTFPELLNIKNLVKDKCIFDGEIVVLDEGRPSFNKLQERTVLKNSLKINYLKKSQPVTFVVFDILYEDKDLTDLPLIKRKKILDKYPDTETFIKSRYILHNGIELFKFSKKYGLEGIVAKKKNSSYTFDKRSENWIKIKNIQDSEFYVMGYKDTGGFTVSLLLGNKIKDKFKYVGKVVMGKKREGWQLLKNSKKIKNILSDYHDDEYTYIEPVYQCTVKYLEKTKTGHLRQPVYKGLRLLK